MKKIGLIIFLIINLVSFNLTANATNVSSQICTVTSKVCILSITNDATTKDETVLNACQQCCAAPNLLSLKGCSNRCKKKCATAYKKAIKKGSKN